MKIVGNSEMPSRPSGSHRFSFTNKQLENLPLPASRLAYYNDTKQRGLQLKVYPSGRKPFGLYKKVDGKADRITIGTFPEWTVKEARARSAEAEYRYCQGQEPLLVSVPRSATK